MCVDQAGTEKPLVNVHDVGDDPAQGKQLGDIGTSDVLVERSHAAIANDQEGGGEDLEFGQAERVHHGAVVCRRRCVVSCRT